MKKLIYNEQLPAEAVDYFKIRGFDMIPLPAFQKLGTAVSGHPDMLMLPIGSTLICHKEYAAQTESVNLMKKLSEAFKKKLNLTEQPIGQEYPEDILFNVLILQNRFIGRLPYVSKKAMAEARRCEYTFHDVRQGYAKCSTCVVNESSIVTSDSGIAQIGRNCGWDVLEISSGGVELPGMDHGFIGGASGYDSECVYFIGNLSDHPDGTRISNFCKKHGKIPVSVCKGSLTDYGGLWILD